MISGILGFYLHKLIFYWVILGLCALKYVIQYVFMQIFFCLLELNHGSNGSFNRFIYELTQNPSF